MIFDLRPLLHGKISGVEVFTINIAKALAKDLPKNWELIFWTNASKDFDFGEFKKLGKCIQTKIPNKIFNITTSLLRWPKIDILIRRERRSAFPTDTILFIPDPRPSPVSLSCKKIFTIHDLSPFKFPETFNWKTRLFHKLIRFKKEISESRKIVTVSNFTKTEVLNQFSISDSKISVIHESAEPELLDPNFTAQKLPENLPQKFFLALSTLEPRKNFPKLLDSFSKAQKKNPNLKLIIVGRKNSKIFSELDLKNNANIIWIERFISIAEKKWLYQNAQALLFLSKYEGFGLPILEAMSQGCPVIHGNNSSQNEVAEEAGIPVNVESVDEISKAILQIDKDKNLQEKLSQKGFKRAKEFSWEKAATLLIQLIQQVVSQNQ